MTTEDADEEVPAIATASSIGAWLLQRIEQVAPQHFFQSQAVTRIRNEFGVNWSYQNHNGNWAISKDVLKEFGKLKYTNIRWDRSIQAWRLVTDEQLAKIKENEALVKQRKEQSEALRKQRIEERAQRERAAG